MDLIGHDVNFAVTHSVYRGFFEDPRYRPSLLQQELVHTGWLGQERSRLLRLSRRRAAARGR
jgi:3-hydroxybutyryl-CoA dehydrogenase